LHVSETGNLNLQFQAIRSTEARRRERWVRHKAFVNKVRSNINLVIVTSLIVQGDSKLLSEFPWPIIF